MKLYHYIHCPFCVRVRMALGALNIRYESIVLPYDDEKTPVDLYKKKMLPIFEWSDSDRSNESLEIIKRIDTDNLFKNELTEAETFTEFNGFLTRLGKPIHSLAMPYWSWTKEFDDVSRNYFQKKKEATRGPFNLLVQKEKREEKLAELDVLLIEVESLLTPFVKSDSLTILDIALASHLWGMYIFPEFQFSPKIHAYLQEVKKICNFEYHEDFWKTNEALDYSEYRS